MNLEEYENVYIDPYDYEPDKVCLCVSTKNGFRVLLGYSTMQDNYRRCTETLDRILSIKDIPKNHRIAKNAHHLLKLYFSQPI